MSISVGMGRLAECGILVRQGDALQKASQLDTLVLDKTGTITQGKPKVTEVIALTDITENKVLALAASAEHHSPHPLAQAIQDAADQAKLARLPVKDVLSQIGQGISVKLGQQLVHVGNRAYLASQQVKTSTFLSALSNVSQQGKTAVFVAADQTPIGIILIEDPLKPEAASVIENLTSIKIDVIMTTGDSEEVAHYIASQVGIQQVFADCLPSDKVAVVQSLQQKGKRVGMVGDGINDAPALAQSDVGFAIGAGTDIAINSADIVLVGHAINGLIHAISLSKKIVRNIKQNLIGAFIYNMMSLPIAAGLFYPLTGIMLSPMVACAAMIASSLTVMANASRLKLKPSMLYGLKKER